MAAATRMTPKEHKEIFQTMSESIVAEPEAKVKGKDVDSRALRGALYLDEHHPGWARKIDLGLFSIQDVNNCVVGQMAGEYDDYAGDIFPVGDGYNKAAEDFGIMPTNNGQELQRSWKILISERQTTKGGE